MENYLANFERDKTTPLFARPIIINQLCTWDRQPGGESQISVLWRILNSRAAAILLLKKTVTTFLKCPESKEGTGN